MTRGQQLLDSVREDKREWMSGHIHAALSCFHMRNGDVDTAVAAGEKAVAAHVAENSFGYALQFLQMIAEILLQHGEFQRAADQFRRGALLAQRSPNLSPLVKPLLTKSWTCDLQCLGFAEAADRLARLREAWPGLEDTNEFDFMASAVALATRCQRRKGRVSEKRIKDGLLKYRYAMGIEPKFFDLSMKALEDYKQEIKGKAREEEELKRKEEEEERKRREELKMTEEKEEEERRKENEESEEERKRKEKLERKAAKEERKRERREKEGEGGGERMREAIETVKDMKDRLKEEGKGTFKKFEKFMKNLRTDSKQDLRVKEMDSKESEGEGGEEEKGNGGKEGEKRSGGEETIGIGTEIAKGVKIGIRVGGGIAGIGGEKGLYKGGPRESSENVNGVVFEEGNGGEKGEICWRGGRKWKGNPNVDIWIEQEGEMTSL